MGLPWGTADDHKEEAIKKRPAWGGRPFCLEEAVSKRKEGTFYIATGMPN